MSLIITAYAAGSIWVCGAGLMLHQIMGESPMWWRALLVVCTAPSLVIVSIMYMALPESVHFLMVNGRRGEAHELMRDLEKTNCTKLGSDAHITTREYDHGPQHCDAQSQSTTFQEMISPELWGSTLYILTTFGLSNFLYFGIAYIYPLVLQDLYEESLDDGIFQVCSR
jgi:hypothetical protein